MTPPLSVSQLPDGSERVVYELGADEFEKIDKLSVAGHFCEMDDVAYSHKVCIMQLVSLLTTQSYNLDEYEEQYQAWRDEGSVSENYPPTINDAPICVSEVITEFLIETNDDYSTNEQRERLKQIVPDILNTCPIVRRTYTKPSGVRITEEQRDKTFEYNELERRRHDILYSIDDPTDFEQRFEAAKRAAAVR